MKRINEIKARIVNKAGNPSGVGAGNMKIPGMKIGVQMSPGGPTYEDMVWLIEKVERCREFLKSCAYQDEGDAIFAKKIIEEIEGGK